MFTIKLEKYLKENPKAKTLYPEEISALRIINDSPIQPRPGNIGALQIAVDQNYITPEDAEGICKLWRREKPRELHARGIDNPIPPGTSDRVINIINKTPPSKDNGPSPYYQALYTVMTEVGNYFNKNPKMNELLNKIFASDNIIFISTVATKDSFRFVQKAAHIKLATKESYHPFEAKKKLAFEVT